MYMVNDMDKIRLLILHKDQEYSSALGRALALKDSIYAITLAAVERLSFQSALAEIMKNEYDMILVDQESKRRADCEGIENRERVIGLSEVSFPEDVKGYIYKYGGLERSASELQIAYSEITGRRRTFLHNHKTKVIGFTSGSGGVGTSCIAIALGRELTSLDKRDALYLSFEEIESTPVYIPMDEGRESISEYLYYLLTKEKEGTATFIDSFLISVVYGLCAFRPAKGINELSELPCERQMQFLDSLCCPGRFRYIFTDFHARSSAEIEHLMSCCHTIFLIDDGRPLSLWKNKKFIQNLSPEVCKEIQERIIPVTNKWVPTGEENLDNNRIFIEYDQESFTITDSHVDISLQRCFGLGVKKIADGLTAQI